MVNGVFESRITRNYDFKIFTSRYNVTRICLDPYIKCTMFFLTPSPMKVKDLLDTRHAIAAGKSPIGVNPLLKYIKRGSTRLELQDSLWNWSSSFELVFSNTQGMMYSFSSSKSEFVSEDSTDAISAIK